MKLLTVSAARQDLGRWIKRAVRGQRICIAHGTRFVELRPVVLEPYDARYAEEEYGVTAAEMDRAAATIARQVKTDAAAGRLENDADKSLADALKTRHPPHKKKARQAA
jgi:hypothetical protein